MNLREFWDRELSRRLLACGCQNCVNHYDAAWGLEWSFWKCPRFGVSFLNKGGFLATRKPWTEASA